MNFKSLVELLNTFPDEQSCINHLTNLRWGNKVTTPFSAGSKVYTCKNNKFRCKDTKKYFNVKTGTIFEDTKIPLQKWFMAIFIFTSGKNFSSYQLATDISVTQRSAWFMLHRLKYAFDHPKNI